jgi:Peptidase A4 family
MRRTVFVPLAALALTLGSLVAAAGPASASARPAQLARPAGPAAPALAKPSEVTGDYAGYVASGKAGAYKNVSSNWTEPKGTCAGSGDQYSAFYVGLDGWTSDSIEQIGSELDCIGKTPEYYAWYDMYPADPVYFSNPVDPGDAISASVTYAGSNKFTLKISDATQGWSQSVSKSLAGAARSSAEVLVEAPCCTAGGGALPLADFGSVSFTGAMVNSAGLCDSDPTMVTMPGVTVSAIVDCTNFTVTENKPA